LLLGSWPLAYLATAAVAGRVNDAFGTRRAIALGVVVMDCSTIVAARAGTFRELFVSGILFGVGGSIISTGLPKVVADWFGEGPPRMKASGVYATGPAIGATLMLSLANSVLLPALGSWHGMYWFLSGFGVCVLALWLGFARGETGRRGRELQTGGSSARVVRSPQVW